MFLWKGHFAAAAIIVVSIPVALIIYKLLFGWERQLTHLHTHTKNFPFFREIEKTYMAYILTRGVLVVVTAAGCLFFQAKGFFALFSDSNQDLEKNNYI